MHAESETVAVISDVHANLPALEAVLADVEQHGIRRIWCLGDTLGYGPWAQECALIIRDRCEVVLAGNHDLAVRGDIDPRTFAGTAGAGVRHAIETIDATVRDWLATLSPHAFLLDDGWELYHAAATDPVWDYVKDAGSATRHFALQRQNRSLVGHSHMQLVWTQQLEGGPVHGGLTGDGVAIDLSSGRHVVNPGSVGQPRDGDPRAAWAAVTATSVAFHRVPYDIARAQAGVRAAHLPDRSAARLEEGL